MSLLYLEMKVHATEEVRWVQIMVMAAVVGLYSVFICVSLLLQSPVTIADGVDSSPAEYIFSYNGSSIPVSIGSTPQCTSSSCQHTFRVTSSQVQQYTVTVAARNIVGLGTASTPVTVGMYIGMARIFKCHKSTLLVSNFVEEAFVALSNHA